MVPGVTASGPRGGGQASISVTCLLAESTLSRVGGWEAVLEAC